MKRWLQAAPFVFREAISGVGCVIPEGGSPSLETAV